MTRFEDDLNLTVKKLFRSSCIGNTLVTTTARSSKQQHQCNHRWTDGGTDRMEEWMNSNKDETAAEKVLRTHTDWDGAKLELGGWNDDAGHNTHLDTTFYSFYLSNTLRATQTNSTVPPEGCQNFQKIKRCVSSPFLKQQYHQFCSSNKVTIV